MRNLLIGLVLFLIAGNLIIFGAFKWMAATDANYSLPPLPGIKNLAKVDGHLWRGSAPSEAGYAALADKGVKVIVDLRAEDLKVDRAGIEALGMKLVRLPMRDGQAPTDPEVQKFLTVMRNADGRVYIHCGAGVGRTGTMAASYLVLTSRVSAMEAVQRNLAVGPPSLEQIAFAASLEAGEEASDVTPLTMVSRVLDAPRRLLVRVRHSYQ
jgi:protein-tyrosine phosphatase